MNISIVGQQVQQISCLRSTILETNGGCEIKIESSFRMFDQHGGPVGIDAGASAEYSWVLDRLLGQRISLATHELGALRLRFDSTAELTVSADANVRAWTIAGPDGSVIASAAVGDLV